MCIRDRGEIVYKNEPITHLGRKKLKWLREHMQIVFQDPYSSLDARMKEMCIRDSF